MQTVHWSHARRELKADRLSRCKPSKRAKDRCIAGCHDAKPAEGRLPGLRASVLERTWSYQTPNELGVFKVSCRGGFLRINGMLAVTTLLPYETGPC